MAAELLARIRAEIDERLAQLRPALEEYERLLQAADAFDVEAPPAAPRAAARARRARGSRGGSPAGRRAPSRGPAPSRVRARAVPRIGPSEQAILAALEHGSHTVAELAMVTAMSGAQIRESARRLLAAGSIVRAKREGKAAYALAAAA